MPIMVLLLFCFYRGIIMEYDELEKIVNSHIALVRKLRKSLNLKTDANYITLLEQMLGFVMNDRDELKQDKKKFDRTKYDPEIFNNAIIRYNEAPIFDKKYDRCLYDELVERGIAIKGFEETEEFFKWNNAFRTYRSNLYKVRSSSHIK
jgi:hypothetical protein